LKKTSQFIIALQGATLEQSDMLQEDIDRLCAAEPDLCLDLTDKHFVKALRIFLSTTNTPRTTYDAIRSSMVDCYPDDPFLSFRQIKCHIEQLSGVVPIYHDMCCDTCVGSLALGRLQLLSYMQKGSLSPWHPRTSSTIYYDSLGPVIQVLYGSLKTAEEMHHRERTMTELLEYARAHSGNLKEYSDTTCGCDFLDCRNWKDQGP